MRRHKKRRWSLDRWSWFALALLLAAGAGRPALAAGLSADNSQLFFETSANPLHPPEAGDQLGYAVATGDFDGDGVDDLAIGLRNDDQPIGPIADVGQVQIRFGIVGPGLQAQGATVKYIWQGGASSVDDPEVGDHFGESLAVGDFDGDGFDDLAIGIPGEDVGTISNAGAVEVRYGAANRSDALASRRQLFHEDITGVPDNAGIDDEFGHALATGDFDGDSFDDLAIAVPLESVGGDTDSGRVFAFYGSASGLGVTGVQTLDSDTPGTGTVSFLNQRFGTAIAAADFDQDGFDDLAVGLPGWWTQQVPGTDMGLVGVLPGTSTGLTGTGSVFFRQGFAGMAESSEDGDLLGASLAVGRFNADSFPDLAVGVPGESLSNGSFEIDGAGAVHVLFGSASGVIATGSQFWSANSTGVPDEPEVGDGFGFGIVGGDFNGDGIDELAVGVAFEQTFRGPEEGDVVVLPGTASGLTGAGSANWNLETPGILGDMNPGDHLGWCLAVGNFAGGGGQDLAIGIPNDGNIGGVLVLYGTAPFNGFANGFEGGNLTAWSSHTP